MFPTKCHDRCRSTVTISLIRSGPSSITSPKNTRTVIPRVPQTNPLTRVIRHFFPRSCRCCINLTLSHAPQVFRIHSIHRPRLSQKKHNRNHITSPNRGIYSAVSVTRHHATSAATSRHSVPSKLVSNVPHRLHHVGPSLCCGSCDSLPRATAVLDCETIDFGR